MARPQIWIHTMLVVLQNQMQCEGLSHDIWEFDPDQRRKFIVEDVNIKILQEILEDHDYFWPKQLKWPANIWGEGSGNPLQYSCLENPMDRGAW